MENSITRLGTLSWVETLLQMNEWMNEQMKKGIKEGTNEWMNW